MYFSMYQIACFRTERPALTAPCSPRPVPHPRRLPCTLEALRVQLASAPAARDRPMRLGARQGPSLWIPRRSVYRSRLYTTCRRDEIDKYRGRTEVVGNTGSSGRPYSAETAETASHWAVRGQNLPILAFRTSRSAASVR